MAQSVVICESFGLMMCQSVDEAFSFNRPLFLNVKI